MFTKNLYFSAKLTPFLVEFISDNYEYSAEKGTKGFKLAYYQDATGC